MNAEEIVREFWRRMNANDFFAAGDLFSVDFVAEWPQSNERIVGANHYSRINAEYPANGKWRFTIHQFVASDSQVVTDVTFTDSVQYVRVVSFFTVRERHISKLVEYFPEPYSAPPGREHLTEPLTNQLPIQP